MVVWIVMIALSFATRFRISCMCETNPRVLGSSPRELVGKRIIIISRRQQHTSRARVLVRGRDSKPSSNSAMHLDYISISNKIDYTLVMNQLVMSQFQPPLQLGDTANKTTLASVRILARHVPVSQLVTNQLDEDCQAQAESSYRQEPQLATSMK